jgi:hypothetical protein
MMEIYDKNKATSAEAASMIVPRAEFRVFGQGIIDIVKQKMWDAGAVLQKARRMPPETYFLSAKTSDVNVKVRDGLLDIKTKVGETPEGYEIFQPRGKFQFPVKREELAAILKHLEVKMALERGTYSIEEFIAMAYDHPDLVTVTVEKMRYGFTVGVVICEFAQVWFNGALVESACCESENYAAMHQAVEALGIANLSNTNYLRAAKRVVGMDRR